MYKLEVTDKWSLLSDKIAQLNEYYVQLLLFIIKFDMKTLT